MEYNILTLKSYNKITLDIHTTGAGSAGAGAGSGAGAAGAGSGAGAAVAGGGAAAAVFIFFSSPSAGLLTISASGFPSLPTSNGIVYMMFKTIV